MAGRVVRVVRAGSAAGGSPTSFDAVKSIYDDLGRPRKTTNPYVGDANGDTFGLPFPTTYDYDELSRVKLVTLPDGNTVATNYNGAVVTVTDQVGRQRRSEADSLGRVIRVTEMDDSKLLNWVTTYGYDMNDNLTSVDQGGQTRAFKYDSLSRMTFERTPEQDATISDGSGTFWSATYTYTDFNAVLTRQDARGVISTYGYDGLNRLSSVSYNTTGTTALATAIVGITYGSAVPKLGRVEEVKQTDSQSNVPWKENYVYDTLSRVSSKTVSFDNQAGSYATGYAYNQAGQLTQMTYPSTKVIKYGFDSRGRFQTLGDGSLATKYISSVSYQTSGQIGSISLGNGVNETYGYSADRLQLTSQTATKNGNTLMSMTYNYVADKSRSGGVGTGQANTGQLMDITATIKDPSNNTLPRNESYNYDQVSRLTQASGFYAQRNYTYDRFGNRTAVTGGSSQNVTLQQPGGGVTNNRIASVNGGASYQYDAAGDVTFDAAHSYGYDGESRIVVVDSGSTATYFYDSANRRVKKLAAGFTTYYVWEGSKVIAEYSNAPAGSGGTRFYHPDRLSNRVITDGTGLVKGTMDNLPFGEDGGVIGESEKHRFTSYDRDSETSSDHAVNRRYLPSTGRFNRPDPLGGSISNPQSLNRYAYTQGDPTNLIDPLGLVVYYCSPQYSSCATLTLYINGIAFAVNVGFTGGHGTFLWNQLGFLDQMTLARQTGESTLPEGFDIFFKSLQGLVTEKPGSIANGARTKTINRINKEIEDCAHAGAGAAQGSQEAAERFAKFVGRKAAFTAFIEAGKTVGQALVETGVLTDATVVGRAVAWGSKLPMISPAGVALLFLQLSYISAPTEGQLEGERQFSDAKKQCAKAISKKYGLP